MEGAYQLCAIVMRVGFQEGGHVSALHPGADKRNATRLTTDTDEWHNVLVPQAMPI
jgi:hypothetical protein